MADSPFIHLRVHSAYSLAEGAIHVKEVIELCRRNKMPAVAVTDTGNLFGALEFALAARDAGIQPIIGSILHVAPDVDQNDIGARMSQKAAGPITDQIVLLCQTRQGYENLMALLSKAFMETPAGETPHIAWDDLRGRTDGLIALTGGPDGPIARLLAANDPDGATAIGRRMAEFFPGRTYVELQRHETEREATTEAGLVDLAYDLDLPLVATNDCLFATEDMHEAHDALLCIAEGTYVNVDDRRRVTAHHRFKSSAEMAETFSDLPEAIQNTTVIARRCAYMPDRHDPILPAFPTDEGRTEVEELCAQARLGLEHRLGVHVFADSMDDAARDDAAKPYRERLEYELGVIENMGFPGYFLIVSDFIKWAKNQDIPVGPGRGSGAGSVVAWALTITDLDPLRFGLLFERFLNPERVSMPDFDIDFCQDRRDEVIGYVQDKYGTDKVAQIITFGKLQARAVLRDVGRVLQMPYGKVDRICKMVPNNPAKPVTLAQAIEMEPELREVRREPDVSRMVDMALKLEGLYRHASTHAAGVVIGDRPLDQWVALYRDPRSPMPVTQFNMKYVEQAGLVKFDFLGLKTLTVLKRAVELVEQTEGVPVDLTTIPLDDAETYEMLARGETVGVFQLESSGMRDVLKQLKPNRFEDIIALVALYRPGPMDNIPTYIEVKNGTKQADYLHPSLEPILKETFGIMIYQEQVMQVAQVLAGYSLGAADLLRRAMGKKVQAEMDAQKKVFTEGAVARGVPKAQAVGIFDQVNKFAGYGFNKSHAAAYALVAYQTAYLKANYPVEFLAASMTLDLGNTDKLNTFRQELDRIGIALLTPDVNRSDSIFGVERNTSGTGDKKKKQRAPETPIAAKAAGKAIRYALGAIKGVGLDAMAAVIDERGREGGFQDIFDFARRQDSRVLNRRQMENLIRAGAFDGLDGNRRRLLEGLDVVLKYASTTAAERASGQTSLFGGDPIMDRPPLPDLSDWDDIDRLNAEFSAIGFYLSAHPLDSFNTARIGVIGSADARRYLSGGGSTTFNMAGIVVAKREMTTKTKARMAFVTLSDNQGVFEVTFFSETLGRLRELMEDNTPLLLAVEAQRHNDDFRFTALKIDPLDQAVAQARARINIHVADDRTVAPLSEILQREGRGGSEIHVFVPVDEIHDLEMKLPGGYALSARGRSAIKGLPGVTDIREV
ncbi:DNA polymerase III subunit alpha [Fodinicurvata sp. EGI_FJ10296]|uniref:DNA polymerase III subunit alpha n=1 Tax=Fodinicurvata sp. EGI_FJ10296 TaxID=3231908 RepID=UPI003456E793